MPVDVVTVLVSDAAVLVASPKVAVVVAVPVNAPVEPSTVATEKDVTVGTGDVMLLLRVAGTTSVAVAFEIVVKEFVAVISGGGPWVPLTLSVDTTGVGDVFPGPPGIVVVNI